MARTTGQKGYFDFSRGIITEGSSLTYEPNSLLDSLNVTFSQGKPLRKRLGQYSGVEDSETVSSTGRYGTAIESPGIVGTWLWQNAGGRAGKDIFLFVEGNVLVGMEGTEVVIKTDLIRYNYPEVGIGTAGHIENLSDLGWGIIHARFAAIGNDLYVIAQYEKLTGYYEEKTSRLIRFRFPYLSSRGSLSAIEGVMLPVEYRDFGDASNVPNEVGINMDLYADMWVDDDSPYKNQAWNAIYDMFNRGWTHLFTNLYQRKWPVQDSLRDIYNANTGSAELSSTTSPISGTGGFLSGSVVTALTTTSQEQTWSHFPPLQFYRTYTGKWASKATVPALGIGPSIQRLEGVGYKQNRAWDVDPYRTTNFGSGSAPKGHVICDIHRENARGYGMAYLLFTGGKVGTFNDGTVPGPEPDILSSIATFYGRVVMGSTSGKVYMSQLHKDSVNDYAGKCYQEQDPTDKDFNELLATDGTVIDIGAAGAVVSLVPFAGKLLVFTTNGIWSVGGSESSYDITTIGVEKLYDSGVYHDRSIVSFPGGVVLFSESGILMIRRDPTVGTLSVDNISDSTIRTLFEETYNDLEVTAAVYDPTNARVEWFFGQDMLQLDIRSGGFFRHRFGKAVDFAIKMPPTFKSPTQELVTVAGATVTVAGEDVTVDATTTAGAPDSGLLYISLDVNKETQGNTYGSTTVTRSYLIDTSMYDMDNINYDAYAIAGFDTMSDPASDKDIDRMFIWFDVTEDGVSGTPGNYTLNNQSACDLSVRWEWSTDTTANRWYNIGNVYEVPVQYTIDDGPPATLTMPYEINTVSRDIHGQGKSVLFRFDAQEGKHMSIWGWAVTASSEVNP